ncbi:MAG: TonB-dependent receptor, partial [Deltaproteobacteria bacterium]|nr:TonB-dependent receptor [Candidatus Zymogenaceae bacterium]
VAENITVITAREIERMNAHSVAEVLNRIPGVLLQSFTQDFGAPSLMKIQGSEDRHVLVLVDGISWNFMASGGAEANSIPVGIIERIEVVKGPASSAWGSSLGGVVNIITKEVGTTERPTGSLQASYGERETQDYRAQFAGEAGRVGYYLFVGRQESDGLRDSRKFDTYQFYSKINASLGSNTNLGFTLGYTDPEFHIGDFPSGDLSQTGLGRTFFVTSSLDAAFSKNLSLQISFHHFQQKSVQEAEALGLGFLGLPGERFLDTVYDESTTGGSAKLVWEEKRHTAVLGIDLDYGTLHQTLTAGSLLQMFGAPAQASSRPEIDKWAVYANDTFVIGKFSITPGVRYDHNSITGSFTSPSLGITYRVRSDSIVRASVARGFTIPPLSTTSGGGLFLDPNSSLDEETVWSYQAGFETAALKHLWIKINLFRHELDDFLVTEWGGGGPPTYNDIVVNNGEVRRQGFELEAETVPFHHFSLLVGFSYVHFTPSTGEDSEDIYEYTVGMRYDDADTLYAELFGHYVWWDNHIPLSASYDDFIVDLNLTKRVYLQGKTAVYLFSTAHNLLNGFQYLNESKNPRRWMEAGVRITF